MTASAGAPYTFIGGVKGWRDGAKMQRTMGMDNSVMTAGRGLQGDRMVMEKIQ